MTSVPLGEAGVGPLRATTGNTVSVPVRPLISTLSLFAPRKLRRSDALHATGGQHRCPSIAASDAGQPERDVGRITDHRVGRSRHCRHCRHSHHHTPAHMDRRAVRVAQRQFRSKFLDELIRGERELYRQLGRIREPMQLPNANKASPA